MEILRWIIGLVIGFFLISMIVFIIKDYYHKLHFRFYRLNRIYPLSSIMAFCYISDKLHVAQWMFLLQIAWIFCFALVLVDSTSSELKKEEEGLITAYRNLKPEQKESVESYIYERIHYENHFKYEDLSETEEELIRCYRKSERKTRDKIQVFLYEIQNSD